MSGKVNDLNKDISNNADLEESYDSKKANKYMKEAIKQAKKAASIGEVPIGCVIVYQDKIIGRGYNRRMVNILVICRKMQKRLNRKNREHCLKS